MYHRAENIDSISAGGWGGHVHVLNFTLYTVHNPLCSLSIMLCSYRVIINGLLSVDGYGELQFASDDIYRGHWKDGVRHGKVCSVLWVGKGSSIFFI